MSALISLCQNAALLAIGILAYGFARAWLDRWPAPIATVCSGAIFAVLTLLSMLAPLVVFPGFIVDARNTLVALATVFAGPLAGTMAALPAVIYRLEIGGPGAPGAIYSLAIAMLLGWGLRRWAARRGAAIGVGHLALLGVAIALLVLPSLFLIGDPARRAAIFETAMLPFALSTVLGLCGFGMLIISGDRRRALQQEIAQRDRSLHRNQAAMTRILQNELLTEHSLEAQLRAITRQGAEALAIDVASVWQYDQAGVGTQCLERWVAAAGMHQRIPDARFGDVPDIRSMLSHTLVHHATDARNHPLVGPYVARIYPDAGPVSILYAAIRHADRLVGHLAFGTVGRRRDWTLEEETFARSLADLAGLALLQDQLDRQQRTLRNNQDLLVQVVRDHLLSNAPLEAILGAITETIGAALDIDRTGVWLLDPEGDAYRCVDIWDNVQRQHSAHGALTFTQQSPLLDDLKRRLVVGIGDVNTDPLFLPAHRTGLAAKSLKSTMVALIGGPDHPIGILSFATTREHRDWSLEDQTLARSLADLVRLALIQDQLDRREKALRRNQALVIQIVGDDLLRAAPLQDVLNSISAKIGRGLTLDRATVWTVDAAAGGLRCAGRWDNTDRELPPVGPLPIRPGPSLFGQLQRDIVVAVRDVASDPRFGPGFRAALRRDIPKSALFALIGTPGQPIGVLVFGSQQDRDWTLEEQTLIRSLAHLISFVFLSHSYREAIAALDLVGEGIYVQGPSSEVIYANRAARTLGLADFDLEAGATLPAPSAASEGVHELSWITPEGTARELAVSRQRLPAGGVITMLSDITEQKWRQRQHAEFEERLRQSTKMEAIGRLAGGIAHDFNNMIGAILGFGTFLVEDLPAGSAQQDFAKRITQVCERARDIVKQLLAFSRPDDAARRVVDLRATVVDNSSLLQAALPPATTFSVALGPDPLPVLANVGQVSQLLLNLCVNANDALEGQAGSITVTLALIGHEHPDRDIFGGGPRDLESALALGGRLDPARHYGAIRVADSGTGMDQATLEQIFEPFFTTKEGGHGTGLGLAVVHGIVMAYDGAYLVRSHVGAGSEFSLYLPLDETVPEVAAATDGAASLRGDESVLIVDDEVDLTDMLSIGLERLGYDVTCCNDPFEALHAFEQDPGAWDVVVTDHMMPAMRGVALIERLKTISPGVATLLCTGFADGATEEAARLAGADAFLMKPLEARRIAHQMRTLLDQRADTTAAPAC